MKTFEFKGVKYEAHELMLDQVWPIMELMQTDQRQFQLELVKLSIHKAGEKEPMGEAVMKLGLAHFMEFASHAADVQGFGDEGKN